MDLLGGGLAAGCAALLIWFTVLRTDRTSVAIRDLTEDIRLGRQRLAMVRADLDEQRGVLQARREQLDATGELPLVAPIERYFQAVSGLAAEHSLKVLRHNPLASHSYPGLLERRFAYEVSGASLDVISFLKAVEESDFWADVSYLSIEQGPRDIASRNVPDRVARLTISVFSALPPDDAKGSG